jgi:transketolase
VTPFEREGLEAAALRVRERVVRMATGGGCFLGASLSCVDLLVVLYDRFLRVSVERLADPDRDTLLLSKGHDVPALYGVLVERGILAPSRLERHLDPGDVIYWHPNRLVPGVEFHSGSLGHLLPVGLGVAADALLRSSPARVVVVAGDGELDEGSMWESLLVARAWRLSNLLLVVDRNGLQANARTEDLVPLEPLVAKFEAFGAGVRRIDGHDLGAIEEALAEFPFRGDGPSVLVADTVRGKGLPTLEGRVDRWFCNFSEREVGELVDELHGRSRARVATAGTVVR